ncbi:MAG: PfkB family carbohydrate kinase [Alphaproteobacteria bacterium]|jgi:fructokinase|nr:PfkB family carbohydrate kinase [Alphaproteobacteria bacterium]MDP7221930.1 PfkB family carbohydrate kinase [Alphaproteobacteria bacterium]
MATTGLYFVGEAKVDQRQDSQNGRVMHLAPGGSMYFGSLGAAKTLARHQMDDCRSFYVGPVSGDMFGDIIRDDLQAAGVGMDYTRQIDCLPMISVVREDGKGGNEYSLYGRAQSDRDPPLTADDLPQHFHEDRRFFCFGSVATTISDDGQILKDFAERQTAQGAICLYDPNTRPTAIADRDRYRDALERWVQAVSVVKASAEDIAFTYPDLSEKQVAERWLSLGVRAVFVTGAEKGCTFYVGDAAQTIAAKTHPAITHTVGAGDNFNAGILVGIAQAGISTTDDLADLTAAAWRGVAVMANETAFAHLLDINDVTA